MKDKAKTSLLKITSTMLKKWGACEGQRDLFKETFPRGATISYKNAGKAAEAGLAINFLASRLLSGKQLEKYEKQDAIFFSTCAQQEQGVNRLHDDLTSNIKLSSAQKSSINQRVEVVLKRILKDLYWKRGELLVDVLRGEE